MIDYKKDETATCQAKIMKKRRKELGFRQEDVAEEAGITVQHYQNLEYGKRLVARCSTVIGLRLCAALELDSYELVFEDGWDYIKRVKEADSSALYFK